MDTTTDEEPTIDQVDGYGLPFPPEVQERHKEYVLKSLHEYQEWFASQKIEYVEPEWKDKPAGAYEKGSGV